MPLIDATEAGFWQAIADAPDDASTRLIFADWLEENGDARGPLFRERRFWPHLAPDRNDPVEAILAVLDASSTGPAEPLLQACWPAAAMGNGTSVSVPRRCSSPSHGPASSRRCARHWAMPTRR